ncbi:hypothetical protein HHI36_012847 [Cryptolaemus montrouzieri]|uniref:SIAH-type domain-containing protein n=1 Tax=Cryptolaemus montrouzieri TaxID=559131 RepID=A0ABD2NFK6_9CUCU
MMRVSDEISWKFKCSNCDGFLSAKPINADCNNTQICAPCYEVLSDEDKEKYVPQTVFESIAELFIFPCRYKNNGCKFEYVFGENLEHERDCRFKFDNTLENELKIGNWPEEEKRDNYICGRKTSAFESVCVSSQEINLKLDFQICDSFYANGIGRPHLKYSFCVDGNDGYQLDLKNSKQLTETKHVKIIGEGVLSLDIPLNSVYCDLKIDNDNRVLKKLCNNCQNSMNENTYHCLFGHDACKSCKGRTCSLCQTLITGESKSYCRNRHKGCPILEHSGFLVKHEIDCEFNNFRCPFPRCVFLNSLCDLKQHCLVSHKNNLIQNNHIREIMNGKKDKKWIMYYCDNLFVCMYYYFVSSVEFIVKYVGANDKSKLFRYEVDIMSSKSGCFKKNALCAGWNDISLCKSISYERQDLVDPEDRFQFTVDLKILHNTSFYTSL